jgi:MarR family transcriptional regulator, temperature-dependent positive regulator of motility
VPATKSKGTITLLAQLTKVVHRKTTEELLGMRWRHFIALSVLYDQPALSQQSLCEALVTDPNNCVLLLNEMESLGYVERKRDPADRRRHIVELTDTGREMFQRGILAREAVEDDVLKALDADERQTLRALLAKALGD